ncbi:Cell division topological determinant MinJ [Paraliobacillus sp. PM-2]|uniref:PDZ domain-containing protein n=1 Tax=Paraliobacillus sp. PM-2 TaxID=1462524 RepID=UPI00061C1D68|nr:PDZ domain-containing protein [Paraliobacillus sp. PM-2]CQR46455.1 Cell division topological determinant MinJ [Paraliobacillus sp. PM-2]
MKMDVWLMEIAKGIGRFFFNPLFYCFFIIILFTSLKRIKKERKMFGSKIFDVFDEVRYTWKSSLLFSLITTILTVGLGVSFTYTIVGALSVITLLSLIINRFTWLSAAYTFGFSYLLLLLTPYYMDYLPFQIERTIENNQWVMFTTLMGLFLLYESYMMLKIQQNETFPERIKGTRGKYIGQHRLKKATLIPLVTLLPIGELTPLTEWWPMIPIGNQQFGLIFFPVVIGFEQVIRGMLPKKALHGLAQSLLILSFIVMGTAIAGYYLPIFTLISVVIALIGREWLSIRFRMKDRQKGPFFTPEENGLRILSVIPTTPADEIGLQVGEKITKVNGRSVHSEQEFYEALQLNSAHCKLDVLDERGEIRFVQRALYQGEHYELGIIFCTQPSSDLAEAR